MAGKRKKTCPAATPPLSKEPRRSARRSNDVAKDTQIKSESKYNGALSENEQMHQEREVQDSAQEVEDAKRDLCEMEHKLQRALKRQRLAVETSNLGADTPEVPELSEDSRQASSTKEDPPEDIRAHAELKQDPKFPPHGQDVDVETAERGARRPSPLNSEKLPLPWTGRLGYVSMPGVKTRACLNTYLRNANPPVFCSRTCRIASIVEHRHPLQDPSQPEHPTKNRPDTKKPPSVDLGLKYVQALGLANAADIVKMVRWNDKYGIKFMRLSSEMFPFASHEEYGYRLAPFASEVLAEAGAVAAALGHRLTTHPGQFTQIGSPRKEVVAAAARDLKYHDELLSLLKLPPQMDRDAVMILHMGGMYGDKAATLDRFRQNYIKLPDGVKRRMVLENDDVTWSVHDLLPICEELNVPLVLDYHHHNIIFDPSMREGTHDIIGLYDRIRKTWARKGITQKMHYSEQTAAAITPRERRKHSPRVKVLPPCANDMDLMIEAKDKEQAVFELMRTYKLPGWDLFNDLVPFERDDESRKASKPFKSGKMSKNGKCAAEEKEQIQEKIVSPDDFSMGGPNNRVFWPQGMEEWLRPKKREVKKTSKKNGE